RTDQHGATMSSHRIKQQSPIHIQNLKQKITKPEVERLARSLMLLSNPFEEANDFKLSFVCPEYPEFEKLVQEGYLNEAEYVLKAKLNDDGSAEAEVFDWKNTSRWKTKSSDWFLNKSKGKNLDPIYKAPPSQFELNIFHLDNNTFATRNVNKRQVSAWLKSVGGVHIYHNDFRVHPYGDEGSDWLGMNLARVNNPSVRPSTNTSIGRLNIVDIDKVLQQKTDRVGFIEGDTFFELKRFVTDALDWYAAERTAFATKLRNAQKDENEKQVKDKEKALKNAIDKVPDPVVKKELNEAFQASKTASTQQTLHLKQDLKLYRSLATSGTTTAVFSHEVSKPISEIPEALSRADRVVRLNTEPSIYERYKERTSNILGYLNRLSHFAELQLDLLKRNKRRDEAIDVVNVISALLNNFAPLLAREHITVNYDYSNTDTPRLQGAICILEAIITNCITNSMRAFRTENFDVDNRTIEIVLEQEAKGSLLVRFSDNGPGITDLSIRDIWLPGITTADNGTGFGLTIVKDSVSDLGGSCRVDAHGHLGGATFYFEFVTI
uniref:sensor histidine kinase n=1 Tax=Vibrio fluvialis TaxID=676 RepID=UPI00301C2FC5